MSCSAVLAVLSLLLRRSLPDHTVVMAECRVSGGLEVSGVQLSTGFPCLYPWPKCASASGMHACWIAVALPWVHDATTPQSLTP